MSDFIESTSEIPADGIVPKNDEEDLCEEKKDSKNADDDDEEGLHPSYDAIICGTGLTQSILAAALSRAGKSVLHVDGADYYGGLDAVWTFPFLQHVYQQATTTTKPPQPQPTNNDTTLPTTDLSMMVPLYADGETHSLVFHSVERHFQKYIAVGEMVVTPYGKGTLIQISSVSTINIDTDGYHQLTISLALSNWKLADGSAPTLYVGVPSSAIIVHSNQEVDPLDPKKEMVVVDAEYLWQHNKIRTWPMEVSHQILERQSRSLALDLTPYLIYADGPAVNGLLESSVSEYLEFKSLQALYFIWNNADTPNNNKHRLTRVPCSKNDVFASKLLSPMEKRRLMKFLQTAMDYGAAAAIDESETPVNAIDEVQSLNERHLNQGRSLSRPQNKPVNSTDLEQLQAICRQQQKSPTKDTTVLPVECQLETYLREHQKLSPALIQLVRYALTLETGDESFFRSQDDDDKNNSRIMENTTKSGMERLCAHMQALGRFGTTAFLVPLYGSGELTQAFCRCAAVYGATYLLRRTPVGIQWQTTMNTTTDRKKRIVQSVILQGSQDDPEKVTTKSIACTNVIVSEGALAHPPVLHSSGKRVVRRISVLSGKPMAYVTEEDRPQSQPEQQQRHVVIIPPGTIVGQTSTIHVLFLDEGVNVAPHVPGGCTVAHLTTTVRADTSEVVPDALLKDALQLVLDLCSRNNGDPNSIIPTELFHASFSYELFPKDDDAWSDCAGMHVLHRARPGLSADQSFEQAAKVFHEICPGHDFLKISKDLEKTIQERLGDQAPEDEDKRVLESALEMIGALPEEKVSGGNPT